MRPRKLNLNRRLREISFVHRKMSFSGHFPLMRLIEFSFAESVKQEGGEGDEARGRRYAICVAY